MFWLPKFFQKIDPNARMPRIFMDSVNKSALNICEFSRNIFIRLDAVDFTTCYKINTVNEFLFFIYRALKFHILKYLILVH